MVSGGGEVVVTLRESCVMCSCSLPGELECCVLLLVLLLRYISTSRTYHLICSDNRLNFGPVVNIVRKFLCWVEIHFVSKTNYYED